MQFRLPRTALLNRFEATPSTNPFEVAVLYQGALGDDAEDKEEDTVTEFGNTSSYPGDEINLPGNGFASVRGLMQKPSRVFWSSSNVAGYPYIYIQNFMPLGGPMPTTVVNNTWFNTFTWMSWYKAMFSSITFSTRISMLNFEFWVGAYPLQGPTTTMTVLACGPTMNPAQFTGDAGREI